MIEDLNLMFSSIAGGYQETIATVKNLSEADSQDKIMPDGRVLNPIKVFKEGTYASITRAGKPIELVVTKERMEKWLANTRRDVPFNQDHNRVAGPNDLGWLRVRSGTSYVALDPEDGKWALYAQPELTDNLFNMVKNGRYRDVSLEIDTSDDVIVGIAVTNYPRVKTLTQMSEITPEMDPKEVPTTLNDKVVEALFGNSTFVDKLNQAVKPQVKEIDVTELELMKAEFEKQLSEMKAALTTSQEDKDKELAAIRAQAELATAELDKMRKEKEAAEWQAKRAKTILGFSEMVDKLISNDKGDVSLPAGVKDDVVELFAHLADNNDTALFSDLEEDKRISPVDLFERILTSVAKFSEVMNTTNVLDNGAKPVTDAEPEDNGYGEALRNMFRLNHGNINK